MDALDGPLVFHGKVELILVLVCGLVLEPIEAVLLGVVVPSAENVVLVLFEDAILCTMGELGALLVVTPVQRVSEGGGHGRVTNTLCDDLIKIFFWGSGGSLTNHF